MPAFGLPALGAVGSRWEHRRLTHTVYAPADRPEVEVLVEGTWHYGELRMWTQRDDGTWSANVMWTRTHGENRLDTFPVERVRPFVDARNGV